MKRVKKLVALTTLLLIAFMLTGCLSIDMNVKKNGSVDITYTIDASQLQGLISTEDIKQTIEESVDDINDTAGKKIAKLKSVKEKNGTITAILNVSDINDMNDGSFFGKVKEYRKDSGKGLNKLVDSKDKSIDEDKVSNNLHMVYFPMDGLDEYGLVEVTVTVPGSIKYITSGGEIEKGNTAVFNGQSPLVVYKQSGGFPIWLILIVIIAIGFVFLRSKKKPSASTPVASPVNVTPTGEASLQMPVQASVSELPVEPPVETVAEASVETLAETVAASPAEASAEPSVETPQEAPQELEASTESQTPDNSSEA